jgi:UDP-GlcNAc:undecaprenyl-phosphate GlcNAc-1-phosphate transferase
MEMIYSFTVALFLTIALIPVLIRYSAKLQLLDDPGDERKVHDNIIPRSGGLAMAIGIFLPLIFLLPLDNELKGLFWGALIIVVFGVADDRHELDYKWKFAGQIAAVSVLIANGVTIDRVPFLGLDAAPQWLSLPLTFFFILGATNAVNLSDGLDGLAAGTSLLSMALLAVFAIMTENTAAALIALTIIGGILGFLRYNTFPARIFMGDTGSQFLGFSVASLAILISQSESSALSPVIPLLVLGLPILDTLTVMAIRIHQGRSPFSPDKNHLHHQIMARGFYHHEAVAIIYILQVLMMGLAFAFCFSSDLQLLVLYGVFCSIVLVALYWSKQSNWQFRQDIQRDEITDRRNQYLRKLSWIYHYSPLLVEGLISAFLIASAVAIGEVRGDFAGSAILVGLAVLLAFLMIKNNATTICRLSCYSASVFMAYFLSQAPLSEMYLKVSDGYLIAMALFLMLSIRMTRRVDFRLDNQDLLVLLIILIVPQLPFKTLDSHSVGKIALHLAVLMYACEFILARRQSSFRLLTLSSIVGLLMVGVVSFS